MKLRIRNDSLRLRLNQDEVERFAAEGVVEDVVSFGPSAGQGLAYRIRRDGLVPAMRANLANNTIEIIIPAAEAAAWSSTKQVGMELDQDIGNGRVLNILVEKDFARLKPRSPDDVLNKFPHPRSED